MVDAGGFGLAILFDAFAAALLGRAGTIHLHSLGEGGGHGSGVEGLGSLGALAQAAQDVYYLFF